MKRLAAALVVLTVVIAGCASDEDSEDTNVATTVAPTTTAAATAEATELSTSFFEGRWRGVECQCTVVFEGGSYEIRVVDAGATEQRIADVGTYDYAENTLTFASNADTGECTPGDEWTGKVVLLTSDDGDRILVETLSDGCTERSRLHPYENTLERGN